jgi:hypothetical protein
MLKISNANLELATLTPKRDEAIAAGNSERAIRLRDQLKPTQERVENWAVIKLALGAKVRVCEGNDPEAAKLRNEVKADWEETRNVITAIAKAQQDIADLLEKLKEPRLRFLGIPHSGSMKTEQLSLSQPSRKWICR